MQLDEGAIAKALVADTKIRQRIERDYGIGHEASLSPNEFVDTVIDKLDQAPSNNPREPHSNAQVFEAAVRALGSNSRSWATFLRNAKELRNRLGGFDPAQARGVDVTTLAELLPGTTATRDAQAILKWAKMLAKHDADGTNYYDNVVELAALMEQRARVQAGVDLPNEQLMLCVVGHLIDEPPKKWNGPRVGKLAGMRFALGSEFFRNMGWNGFKPDRHVIRLLDRWARLLVQQQSSRVNALTPLIGRNTKELRKLLGNSLAGIEITPGDNYSRADNMIWLLGAYVEKKGKESDTRYVR